MSAELSEAFIREQTVHRIADQIRATGQALPGTEGQIAKLIGDDFALGVGNDGLPQLSAKSGRPVAEEIAAKLADPAYAHFKAPETVQAEARASVVEKLRAAAQQQGNLTDAPGLKVRRIG